jgi:hypothetical protein
MFGFGQSTVDDFGNSMPVKSPGGVHLIIAADKPRAAANQVRRVLARAACR